MPIEWFRDLVIIIFGIIAIGTSVFFMIIAYSLYKRIIKVLGSLDEACTALETVSSYVSQPVSQPINLLVSLIQDVRDGIENVGKIFQRGT
ncbi:MAG: hypothetical protein HYX80_00825 [Chloroflexi bacterium]|nr:hypothetical protein [Chloroflexota bacterium]